jgi:hypothetical protein
MNNWLENSESGLKAESSLLIALSFASNAELSGPQPRRLVALRT